MQKLRSELDKEMAGLRKKMAVCSSQLINVERALRNVQDEKTKEKTGGGTKGSELMAEKAG